MNRLHLYFQSCHLWENAAITTTSARNVYVLVRQIGTHRFFSIFCCANDCVGSKIASVWARVPTDKRQTRYQMMWRFAFVERSITIPAGKFPVQSCTILCCALNIQSRPSIKYDLESCTSHGIQSVLLPRSICMLFSKLHPMLIVHR